MQCKTRILLAVVAAMLPAGCSASGPTYAELESRIPALEPGQGRIYFYREEKVIGSGSGDKILLNGEGIGISGSGYFFFVDRPPGSYEAVCGVKASHKLTFTLAAGETKYVESKAHFRGGILTGALRLYLADPAQAAAAIRDLHYWGDRVEMD
jgi:hypothetical protein